MNMIDVMMWSYAIISVMLGFALFSCSVAILVISIQALRGKL